MKKKQYKNSIYLLIPSSIVLVAWIGFTIYNNRVATTITESQSITIQPIPASFNTNVLEKLKKRSSLSPDFTIIQDQSDTASEGGESSPPPQTTDPGASPEGQLLQEEGINE